MSDEIKVMLVIGYLVALMGLMTWLESPYLKTQREIERLIRKGERKAKKLR